MTEQELKVNEMEEIAGGAGKDGPGGYAKRPPEKAGCIIYQIQRGDNLTKIASAYKTTVAKIKAANAGYIVNPSFIQTGKFIYIPIV